MLHIPFYDGPSLKKPTKYELSVLISFNFSFIEIRFWRQDMQRSKIDIHTYIQTDTDIYTDRHRQTGRLQTDLLIIFLACDYLYSVWKEHTNLFILVIKQLDAQNFCFTISLFHIISGIITPIGVMISEAV